MSAKRKAEKIEVSKEEYALFKKWKKEVVNKNKEDSPLKSQTAFERANIETYDKFTDEVDDKIQNGDTSSLQFKPFEHKGLAVVLGGFGGGGDAKITGYKDKDGLLSLATIQFCLGEEPEMDKPIDLGVACIDSGRLMITDPSYVLPRE